MLEQFNSYLLYGSRFCGVEQTSKNGVDLFLVTCLKKTKKEVDLERSFSAVSIMDVSKKLANKQHICLIINNDHVLTKVLETEETDALKLVNKAFPNINSTDFYFEIVKQNKISLVAICRRDYVDSIIKTYSDFNVFVTNFSLGNNIVSCITGFIEASSIQTSNALLAVSNKSIDAITSIDKSDDVFYNINGLNTASIYMVSLSGALSAILNQYNPLINYESRKNELIELFKQIRFFNQFLKTGLVFILGILLINFLFFNFYFTELTALNETSQVNLATKNKILSLSTSVNKSQKITEDLLKSSDSKSAFYVNAIVQSLPMSIVLSELNYQPLERQIKPDKTIELMENTILVSGESNDSKQYSDWVATLENLDWIDKVWVESYSDSKTSSSSFSIKIQLFP